MRTDSGREVVGVARIAGDVAPPWITHQWQPDRENTVANHLGAAASRMAVRGLANMLREFWPDIARKTHVPARFRQE
jgi:hypothetical protein